MRTRGLCTELICGKFLQVYKLRWTSLTWSLRLFWLCSLCAGAACSCSQRVPQGQRNLVKRTSMNVSKQWHKDLLQICTCLSRKWIFQWVLNSAIIIFAASGTVSPYNFATSHTDTAWVLSRRTRQQYVKDLFFPTTRDNSKDQKSYLSCDWSLDNFFPLPTVWDRRKFLYKLKELTFIEISKSGVQKIFTSGVSFGGGRKSTNIRSPQPNDT